MTSLRQQISRKRLMRQIKTIVAPAVLGVSLGVGGFFALDQANSAPAQAVRADAQPQAERAPYRSCAAARAAGAAPVRANDPGYGPHLDRDGDEHRLRALPALNAARLLHNRAPLIHSSQT